MHNLLYFAVLYYNMCKAEAFRFRELKTVVEEEHVVDKSIPSSNEVEEQMGCNHFLTNVNLHKVGVLSTRIEDMDALFLNYWLSKFVMELAKKSGERYPPTNVYGIVLGFRRYLEEKNGAEGLNALDNCDKRYLIFNFRKLK